MEAVLGLRAQLGAQVDIELVAPEPDFVYQPLAVGEPFGLTSAHRVPLEHFAQGRAKLHACSLEAVDAENHVVTLGDGTAATLSQLSYDVLLVAAGAARREWLRGALHFGGTDSSVEFRFMLEQMEEGTVQGVAFVAPPATGWTLALYELALLTAAHCAEKHLTEIALTLVTPEVDPLGIFGPSASAAVRDLLSDRGIALRTSRYAEDFEWDTLLLHPEGTVVADRIVSLPRLVGLGVPGLPADADKFIPVDEHGAVTGLTDVYAAGDGTTFPVKQGGLAAQQADAAVEAIAARLGAPVTPAPFHPVLRGMLLTGITPTYLRAPIDAQGGELSEVSARPLWWPASKIAGRYLAPFLGAQGGPGNAPEFADKHPRRVAPEVVDEHNAEMRRLALAFAVDDADGEDFKSALKWLDTVERIYGVLPPADAERRNAWERAASSAGHARS